MGADQVEQGAVAFGVGQAGEPLAPGVGRGALGGPAPCPAGRGADESAQQRGYAVGPGPYGGAVHPDGDDERVLGAQCGVEHAQGLGGSQGRQAETAQPLQVGRLDAGAHAAARCPQAVGQGDAGQPEGAAVGGETVEEGVGGRVVGLAAADEQTRGGGQQDERGEVRVPGQVVQVPGRVDPGPQDPFDPVGVEGGQDAVVDDAGGVHHGADRVPAEQCGEVGAVGDVAAGEGDLGAECGEFGPEVGRAGGVRTAPAGQQQTPYAVSGDQVTGDQGAQAAGAAGDEDGAVGVPDVGAAGLGACQARHAYLAVADRGLGLVGGQRRGEGGVRGGAAVGADQQEAAGVLGRRRAHQAEQRGVREVVATQQYGESAAGEACVVEPEPQGVQGGSHQVTCPLRQALAGAGVGGYGQDDRAGHVSRVRQCGEVGVPGCVEAGVGAADGQVGQGRTGGTGGRDEVDPVQRVVGVRGELLGRDGAGHEAAHGGD